MANKRRPRKKLSDGSPTREQHIKREKEHPNICTLVSYGYSRECMPPITDKRLAISLSYQQNNRCVESKIQKLDIPIQHYFFATYHTTLKTDVIRKIAEDNQIKFRYICDECIGISIDETTTLNDANNILKVLAQAAGKTFTPIACSGNCKTLDFPAALKRTSPYLTQNIFNSYHSETEMMRYLKKLEVKDLSLNRAMIPLGSCTMKLNAAAEMLPISWPEFGAIHPFVPSNQAEGYLEMIHNLEKDLANITGFAGISLQPQSGASGEHTGLIVIRNYFIDKGETHRNVCLIPSSAHGTNPASAAMAGMKIIVIKATDSGEIDIDDLKAKPRKQKQSAS
jgi:glycine dehydrogenase